MADQLPITERDMPIGIVTGTILVSMIPIGLLLFAFGNTAPISGNAAATVGISIVYILIAGVVLSAPRGIRPTNIDGILDVEREGRLQSAERAVPTHNDSSSKTNLLVA